MGYNEPVRGGGSRGASGAPVAPSRSQPQQEPGGPEIPDKLYFRIGDVARICDVAPYVLRFWETEFPQLKPNKGGTGQRLYRRREVETALRIKRLLYEEGYTIAGARQLLRTEQRQGPPQLSLLGPEPPETRQLKGLRRELESIAAMLSRPAGSRPAPVPVRTGGRSAAARAERSRSHSLFGPPPEGPGDPN